MKFFSLLLILTIFLNPIQVKASNLDNFRVPAGFKFTKNILLGQTLKPDVSYLQNILNMDINTQVATGTDAGSNLNLTNYYGQKTRNAVDKFQTVFMRDIQYEFMLANSSSTNLLFFKTNPSFIDIYTIAVLNKLILIYNAEKNRINYINTSSSTVDIVNKINKINNSDKDEEVVRFDMDQEQTRATDATPKGIDKNIFAHTPEGQLAQLIGGYELVDKVYNYTPGGFANNTVAGTINGQGLSGGVEAIVGAGAAGVGAAALGGLGSSGTAGVLQPFGGQSTSMTMCTCSANILLYIKDVRGSVLQLIYQPGVTYLYKMYNPRSGVNVLGQYTSGGQCLVYEGSDCSTRGNPVGTMTQLGTSLSI